MSTLPTTRTLLTSLFNSLTATTQQQPANPPAVNEPYDPPSNPLKNLSSSHRALLSTMHVLFTPPMLLQALDLLDRGLVERVVEASSESMDETRAKAQDLEQVQGQGSGPTLESVGEGRKENTGIAREVFPPQANIHLPSSPRLPKQASSFQSHQQPLPPSTSTRNQQQLRRKNTVYQVRSSQPPKSRFRDATSSTSNSSGNIYTVRLEAWNCSCAAFAFASFPASSVYPSRAAWKLDLDLDEDEAGGGEDVTVGGFGLVDEQRGGAGTNERGKRNGEDEGERWEFGGMSMDGKGAGGGGVPCCKHLLACVLGERWDVLIPYVKERFVSREEMAGLGCE
ncbi:hypothetical protein ONS95_010427 [Cadophora gregata]|uniref:uncharacterized protein n=1 Tax=Cadophora gregata TaxID=51156 RepID=UPI0026DBDC9E|nr:uncharacterized protein ONS95_010427 [Cadophora gregata]KAK0122167.1 hypothetical protein ONS95_010427 [Cadophora gregata]KAK0127648.1 hypothetical protein ONS96_007172 [Cadophora gregata f. sp. sojae]